MQPYIDRKNTEALRHEIVKLAMKIIDEVDELTVRPGTIIEIPGSPDDRYVALDMVHLKYKYEESKCDCPVCGGLGIPWGGWFHCQDCTAIGLLESGQMFVPVPKTRARVTTAQGEAERKN